MRKCVVRSEAENLTNAVWILDIRGRVGDTVYRREVKQTVAEHRPKTKQTGPKTAKQTAALALQEQIQQAFIEMPMEDYRYWQAYAQSLGKRVKGANGWYRKVPQARNLFRKAMGDRWRANPDAPVMRRPGDPDPSAYFGDGI